MADNKQVRPITTDTATAATGAADFNLVLHLIRQVRETLWLPSYMNEDEQLVAMRGAIAALEGIGPADELEGMLAVQIVATHSAALECLRRAAHSQQTFEGRQAGLKNAEKLMSLYLRQVE